MRKSERHVSVVWETFTTSHKVSRTLLRKEISGSGAMIETDLNSCNWCGGDIELKEGNEKCGRCERWLQQ